MSASTAVRAVSSEAVVGTPGSAEVLIAGALLVAAIALLGLLLALALGPARRRRVLIATGAAGFVAIVVTGAAAAGAPAIGSPPVEATLAPAPSASAPGGSDGRPAESGAGPTGAPGGASAPPEAGPLDVLPGVPPLAEGRRQFQELAALAIEAAGPRARWREPGGVVVAEGPCAWGTLLSIDAQFTMGEITDTSSDEHDRAVIDDNVEAAARIGAAWREAGLGEAEVLRGEPHFGAGSFSAVDSATIGYDFGVAQPRVVSHCLPAE